MERTDLFDLAISGAAVEDEKRRMAAHEPSGRISASMMGNPTLWNVLKLLGVPSKEYSPYLLRKFARGIQAEDWFAEMLRKSDDPFTYERQLKISYRNGVGYADIAELLISGQSRIRPHEVKSVTNIKFKRLTKGFVRKEVEATGPDEHHILQVCWYALALGSQDAYIHYVASDDLRVASWYITDVAKYKPEIDSEIDAINAALSSGEIPEFRAKQKWQNDITYWPYPQFCGMSPEQIVDELKTNYKPAYERLHVHDSSSI